jgi:hypothetical protein
MRADLHVEWCEAGRLTRIRSRAVDVSEDGVFVRTFVPAARGTRVEIELRTAIGTIVTGGTVAWSSPDRGMGIKLRYA